MSGSELFYAARDGKTEEVRRLLAQKAPLEYKNVRHRPYRKSTTHRPAHALSLCGKRRRGEGLRGGGARARAARSLSRYRRLSLARGPSRSLSRHAPLSLSRTNACTRLLRQGYGDTPLIIAAYNGHEAVVRLLLEASGEALYNAARDGKTEDVRRLLTEKAGAPLPWPRPTLRASCNTSGSYIFGPGTLEPINKARERCGDNGGSCPASGGGGTGTRFAGHELSGLRSPGAGPSFVFP